MPKAGNIFKGDSQGSPPYIPETYWENTDLLGWLKKLIGGTGLQSTTGNGPIHRDDRDPAELLDEFRSYISREIAAGYSSPEEALEYAIDVMGDDLEPKILRSRGSEMLAEEWALHVEKQATWPDITDYDRLDAAFIKLEEKGIVARQNFSCCGSCGSAEIWDEIEESGNAGNIVRGYAFFHQQDTESAVEGGGLYLNYGSVEKGAEAAVTVGHEIADTLTAHGLEIDWNGDLSKRIGVSLDWKRRISLPALNKLN